MREGTGIEREVGIEKASICGLQDDREGGYFQLGVMKGRKGERMHAMEKLDKANPGSLGICRRGG